MDERIGLLDELKITVLIEDYAGYSSQLLAQHGVSYLVEARSGSESLNILFDTGQDAEPLLSNMACLGFDPTAVDLIVLSHCHYDHTGGLADMLKVADSERLPVVAHPDLFRQTFSMKPTFESFGLPPGVDKNLIKDLGGDLVLTTEPLPLMEGVITSGEIKERVNAEKEPTLRSFTITDGLKVPDMMADELSLFLLTAQGLVILTGCSHAGILSIIETAKQVTGAAKIAAVVGGLHLVGASRERIDKTIEALEEIGSLQLHTGHCTGFKAEMLIAERLGDRFHKLRSGMSIQF